MSTNELVKKFVNTLDNPILGHWDFHWDQNICQYLIVIIHCQATLQTSAPKRKSSLILELTFFYYSIFVKLSFCKQLSKVLLQISMASLIWYVFYLLRPFYGLLFSILRYGKWQPQMRSNIVWTNIDELTYQARCILLLNSCRTFLSFILYFWIFFEKTNASPPFRNKSWFAPISRFSFNAVDQKNFTQYPKEWKVGTAVKFCIIKHFQNW